MPIPGQRNAFWQDLFRPSASWSPSGTCQSREHKAQNTYRSAVRKHMEHMPTESWADRCLLPVAISGKSVWSECPSIAAPGNVSRHRQSYEDIAQCGQEPEKCLLALTHSLTHSLLAGQSIYRSILPRLGKCRTGAKRLHR
jgi:hypothetical protein